MSNRFDHIWESEDGAWRIHSFHVEDGQYKFMMMKDVGTIYSRTFTISIIETNRGVIIDAPCEVPDEVEDRLMEEVRKWRDGRITDHS